MKPMHDAGLKVKGRTHLWRTFSDGRPPEPLSFDWKPNQIQYSAGTIAAQALGLSGNRYKIAGMYIEFENVASPTDAVSIPTFGKDEGIEYYDDLQSSAVRDFLRVPLLQNPMVGIETGFEAYFSEPELGNKLTFFAQTQGSAGVHGKTFSDSVNSKVCGVALVATPEFNDRTQDVVFSRSYYAVSEQTVKEPSSQIGVSWEIAFTFDD